MLGGIVRAEALDRALFFRLRIGGPGHRVAHANKMTLVQRCARYLPWRSIQLAPIATTAAAISILVFMSHPSGAKRTASQDSRIVQEICRANQPAGSDPARDAPRTRSAHQLMGS